MNFSSVDQIIFGVYLIGMMALGIWISNRHKSTNTNDYFLAGKSLPWFIIGGSLIASNISAEQMIGMAGSGFALGLSIGAYEFMAGATLLVVAKFLMPMFLKYNIRTMPEFLERRFDGRVRTGLAIFWLLLFVFVNITSLFFLGSLALNSIIGIPVFVAVIGLAIYSATFSIFGGLRAVVWTDLIQVVVLIFGGTLASIAVLNALGEGGGTLAGLNNLLERAPEKFDMIFTKDVMFTNIETGEQESAYALLPGLGVLLGGMWIANLYYWGFNQYIVQRALAAKNLKEAQKGVVFAALIKLFLPFIVVIPGIAAYVLQADISKADEAFPWVVSNYVGTGIRGIVVAAIVAAIGSSLSSIVNSASTIYTLDIHKRIIDPSASEQRLVRIGQIAAAVFLVIGILFTPVLQNFDQIFQYIQKYTGYFSPGILAVFLFGLFWKRTTTAAALTTIFASLPLSIFMDQVFTEMPFLDQMGYNFLILSALMVGISIMGQTDKGLEIERKMFKTDLTYNFTSLLVIGIITAIYAAFW
ncbi:MAG: sodium/solute symporter [Bacteroidota bacterium]